MIGKFIMAAAVLSLVYAVFATAVTYSINLYNGERWNTLREVSMFVSTFLGSLIGLLVFGAFCRNTRFGKQCVLLFTPAE